MSDALTVDAVWDIECADWDKFVCGGLWTPEGLSVHWDEDDFAEALLALPPSSVAWAHAGGRYDVLWLLDWCRRRSSIPDAQIRLSGSSVASLAIKRGPVFRDSCRLIPMALREACGMFSGTAQKERLDFPCRCGRACGGYCAISLDMPHALRQRLAGYLVADLESLRDTLNALREYAVGSGLALSGTVASTAWKTAKERCGLMDANWDIRAYKLARDGYKGGRTQVAKLRAHRVSRYDRASAYPAALKKPVPCGEMRVLDGRTGRLAWDRDRAGVYHATVDIPEMHAPPLPVRHGARLCYPWGRVTGAWPRDELKRAVEVGCTIVDIHEGVAWAREEDLLRPHVEHCFDLRKKATTKPLKTWLKFIANSLTGAFAQDPEQDHVALGDYADDPRYEQVGRYDWIWRRKSFRISSRAHVHWAATLTGDARVELHRQIVHAGDDWCYSDTDSVISTRALTRNIGSDLGEWQLEGTATDYEALAPKVYTYVDDEGGKRFARAKGIPDAVREWDRIAGGETIELDRGVQSLMTAARTDALFVRNAGRRTIHPREQWIGDRLRVGTDRTRAPSVGELDGLK